MADTQLVKDKPMTFNCALDTGHGNLNFVCDTPSHFVLPFCEVWLNFLYQFWVMADTQSVSDKPMTFNYDLDLDHRNLKFVCDSPSIFLYLSVKFNQIPFISFLVMADTQFVMDGQTDWGTYDAILVCLSKSIMWLPVLRYCHFHVLCCF